MGVVLKKPLQRWTEPVTSNDSSCLLIHEVQDGGASWSMGVWGQRNVPSRNPEPPNQNVRLTTSNRVLLNGQEAKTVSRMLLN